jgi:hypothetical protein
MSSNVKSYTDEEILERVKTNARSFDVSKGDNGYPSNYWLCGIRSNEDAFDKFDDKFYLFKGKEFRGVWAGTTNAGTDLLHPSNPQGEAVLEADHIFYDSHEYRSHRGKVMAYCQRISLPIHRDNNRNTKIEESGQAVWQNVGINIHPSSYLVGSNLERPLIGAWSQGCFVWQKRTDFDWFMNKTKGQHLLTLCVLKEW